MVKKAQIRFVLTISLILLVVFGAIFGVSFGLWYGEKNDKISARLDDIENRYAIHFLEDNELVVKVIRLDDFNYTYNIISGRSNYSLEDIESVIYSCLTGTIKKGSMDEIYFKTIGSEKDPVIIACNMSDINQTFTSLTLKTLTALLIIFAVLILIVIGISFKVFEPIKENLLKQKTFISDASHELKTPITIISANADVLKSNDDNKYLDSIKAQAERLNYLVADMLTLTKIDEGKKNRIKEEFSLSDEINETVLPFDAVCFESGKKLVLDIPDNVFYVGDRQGIRQILNILMDNAIKYSSKSGTIKVSLLKERNCYKICVFNTGSEISEFDSNKIFERFYRGDSSRSRKSGGSGLGLSIAKSIADSNKWKISAESKQNESMKITLTI